MADVFVAVPAAHLYLRQVMGPGPVSSSYNVLCLTMALIVAQLLTELVVSTPLYRCFYVRWARWIYGRQAREDHNRFDSPLPVPVRHRPNCDQVGCNRSGCMRARR